MIDAAFHGWVAETIQAMGFDGETYLEKYSNRCALVCYNQHHYETHKHTLLARASGTAAKVLRKDRRIAGRVYSQGGRGCT